MLKAQYEMMRARALRCVAATIVLFTIVMPCLAQAFQYVCPKCKQNIRHDVGSGRAPRECPYCGTKFDGVEGGERFVNPLLSNFQILGVMCLLVTMGLVGGGIYLFVNLTKKKTKKRRQRRPVDDEVDDDEDDELDRRRRRRDD